MQVPGVYYTDSFSPFATDMSTIILIGLTLYHEEEWWVAELCDVESSFPHPDMPVKMFIELSEVIVDLGIITKEFLEEYCILLGNYMYGNVDSALLWLILLAKYLNN